MEEKTPGSHTTLKNINSAKDYLHLLRHMGMIGSSDNSVPTAEDAHQAYFAAAEKLGLKITRFEKIGGQWEWENILYKMDIAVEGIRDKAVYKHIELIRFHKTKNGWYIELPVFRICGIRKNDIIFNPIVL